MEKIKELDRLIDELLPDQKVKEDLAQILWSEGPAKIEIEDNVWVTIPVNCELSITTKAFFREYYTINFGPFKVQIAIGGVEKQCSGILYPKYCFALIYYSEKLKMITLDFYEKML